MGATPADFPDRSQIGGKFPIHAFYAVNDWRMGSMVRYLLLQYLNSKVLALPLTLPLTFTVTQTLILLYSNFILNPNLTPIHTPNPKLTPTLILPQP